MFCQRCQKRKNRKEKKMKRMWKMPCMCEGVCVCVRSEDCIEKRMHQGEVSSFLSPFDRWCCSCALISEANKNNILSMEREIEKDATRTRTRTRTWLRNNEPGLSKMRLPMPKPKPKPMLLQAAREQWPRMLGASRASSSALQFTIYRDIYIHLLNWPR